MMTWNKKSHHPLLEALGKSWIRHEPTAIAVARSLQEGSDLKSFTISLAQFSKGGTASSDATWLELAQVLRLNPKLRSFTIRTPSICFKMHHFRDIMRALEGNTSLRSFAWCSPGFWDGLPFGDDCFLAVAQMLQCNQSLRSFRCAMSGGGSGAELEAVAHALHKNKVLRSFHLEYASQSHQILSGLKSFARVLKENTTLQSFTLRFCFPCGSVVRLNRRLCEENIEKWAEAEDVFAQALQSNVQLQAFRFVNLYGSLSTFRFWNLHGSLSTFGDVSRLDHSSVGQVLRRNKSLAAQVRRLAQVAKLSRGTGFRSLTQLHFQQKIMSYFLPPGASIPDTWHMFQRSPKKKDTMADPACSNVQPSSMGPTKVLQQDYPEVQRNTPAVRSSQESALVQKEMDMKESHDEIIKAVEESTAEAFERENSDLSEALMRSKIDAVALTSKPQLSGDGVVLFRLDRHARASEVAQAILQSPELAQCRAFVSDAGCELQPLWANGAWLLLPFTFQQFEEAVEAGVLKELSHCHILLLARDEAPVVQALKSVPKRKRPLLVPVALDAVEVSLRAEHVIEPSITNGTGLVDDDAHDGTTKHSGLDSSGEGHFEMVVERTFLSMKPVGMSEKASGKSAPARLQRAAASQ